MIIKLNPTGRPSPYLTISTPTPHLNPELADVVPALNWMAVDPAHRLCGIGSLLMTAGLNKADDLNLECWLEGSSMGKPLYEKFGFRSLLKIAFDTDLPDASDEWRKCAHEMTPAAVFAMWRPKRGMWTSEHGQEVGLPWSLGVNTSLNGLSVKLS